MIPEFNDNGYLPSGIHSATLDETAARFGQEPELRRVQMESLRWMVNLAWQAGVERIIVNGSFVTDRWEPNDIDCVLLIDSGFPQDVAAELELLAGLPFIRMEFVDLETFCEFTERIYDTDRHLTPKGMIEVQHD